MKTFALAVTVIWVALGLACKPAQQKVSAIIAEDSLHVITTEDSLFRAGRPAAIPVEPPPWAAAPGARPSATLLDLETPASRDTVAPLADRARRTLRAPAEPKPRS
jgi:hypothetical protein